MSTNLASVCLFPAASYNRHVLGDTIAVEYNNLSARGLPIWTSSHIKTKQKSSITKEGIHSLDVHTYINYTPMVNMGTSNSCVIDSFFLRSMCWSTGSLLQIYKTGGIFLCVWDVCKSVVGSR